MFEATVTKIAADILAKIEHNPNGFTVETLVAKWERDVEWLGFKVGGKAWQREVLSSARAAWIASTKDTSIRIPPSEETLAWGGFLGGEIIPCPQKRAAAESDFDAFLAA